MIRSLPKEVQSLLRSGVAVFLLQQCVEELLLNSIDAGATCVAVKIDIDACKIQVIDNGSGMDRENMERVGTRYCTSKCSSIHDLNNLCFYGYRGEAIASMATMATLVEITSRPKMSVKTFVKSFHEGEASDVTEAQTTRPSAGTTVLISNFFHNMPVRRKRMDSVLEVERVRQRVEAISLMHPSVSFTVKKDCSDTLLVQLPKARNTYYRFVQIHGLNRAQKLREVNYRYGQFEMTGHVGREGHYNSSLQFLFVNGRLLLKTRLHKLLGCLLRRLSSVQTSSPNFSAVMSSPKQKGGADLHGAYIINIKCPYSEYDVCLEPAKTLIEFKDWDSVLLCIEEGIKVFLTKENLISECAMSDVQNLENEESVPGPNVSTEDKTDVEQHDELPEPGLANTKSKTNSYSDPEKEAVDADAGKDLPGKVPENNQNAQCTDRNDDTSALCVSSNKLTHCENSKIAIVDHKAAYDSLSKLAEPSFSGAPKRKLTLRQAGNPSDGCDYGPKIARVTPRHKLTLSFETGSLDKFKRMFGKEAEIKPQTQISDILCPTDSFDHSGLCSSSNLDCSDTMLVKDISVDRSLFKEKSVFQESQFSRNRISLATKLSRKVEHKDMHANATLFNPVPQDTGSIETFPSFLSVVMNNDAFSKNSVVTTELHEREDDRSDEPTFTAPEGQEKSTSTSTSTTEDTELTENTTSLEPDMPQGQIVDLASQHDLSPCKKTGNEEQTANESRGHEIVQTEPVQSDWLTHYDDSLGKLFYINQVTGLSKYENPSLNDTQVPCSTNLTNIAVSVVSKRGFEYRCYPFQTDLILPFLPKPRAERVHSTSIECGGPTSLSTLYSEWNNPVFVRPPQVAVDVTSCQAEGLAVKIHNIIFPYRFTKEMIHSMKVIHQVDKKFLACLINTTESSENEENLLVLVDQHAAHERVRLEALVNESYEDDSDTPGKKRLCASRVSPPLEIHMTEEEIRLLRLYQLSLRDLALEISFPQTEQSYVLVEKLPACFVEKENTEKRRGRRSVIKSITEEYIREHIEAVQSTGRVKATLPLTVHNVLASQACHGAIKFNDELNKEECCSLVASLSSCQLPFQCAHGRPSILPLADLLHLEEEKDVPKPNLRKLRRMYKAWQLYDKN
ncbi:DNA mismatch repair protein Mlh3 isoform X1 [Clarias gariepinus]|uniref:DNA mismatch repair protein Mlh3 isoform X1 n=1 Tax=Clarias gariepinus TaxID=13013 RepID=UPI00234DD2FE|nr:DNA mismatch repair protein Mlh3 isoform X1 [Clarias gariepinus]XP_053339255.1 DNA mismatch repair protein Mlh3 isoform X1 [Clarias gariepinus]